VDRAPVVRVHTMQGTAVASRAFVFGEVGGVSRCVAGLGSFDVQSVRLLSGATWTMNITISSKRHAIFCADAESVTLHVRCGVGTASAVIDDSRTEVAWAAVVLPTQCMADGGDPVQLLLSRPFDHGKRTFVRRARVLAPATKSHRGLLRRTRGSSTANLCAASTGQVRFAHALGGQEGADEVTVAAGSHATLSVRVGIESPSFCALHYWQWVLEYQLSFPDLDEGEEWPAPDPEVLALALLGSISGSGTAASAWELRGVDAFAPASASVTVLEAVPAMVRFPAGSNASFVLQAALLVTSAGQPNTTVDLVLGAFRGTQLMQRFPVRVHILAPLCERQVRVYAPQTD
jgi:hypothetical protein